MTELELLAPAKDLETGIAAITHGADAVYIVLIGSVLAKSRQPIRALLSLAIRPRLPCQSLCYR